MARVQLREKPIVGLKWDSARHERMADGPWVRTVREKSGHPDVFVYRHRVTKRFVVAEWHVEGLDCEELFTLSGPPDHFPDDLPDMEWVLWRLRQTPEKNAKEMFERQKGERKDEQEKLDASESQRKEAVRYLRRKGWHDIADHLEHDVVPFVGEVEGGEEGAEYNERLIDSASTKVVSLPPDLTVKR